MVIKLLGSILVMAATTAIGLFMGMEKTNRVRQLRELKRLMMLLQGDIRYGRTPLPQALLALGENNNTPFRRFFLQVSKRLEEFGGDSFYQVWKYCAEQDLEETSLLKKDKERLVMLGENLGYLDVKMQLNVIELYLNQLEEEILAEAETLGEKVRLSRMLGVLSGIFLVVVML